MRRTTPFCPFLALSLLAPFSASCSSGGGGGGGATVPIDMRGEWSGTWESTANPGQEGTVELDLSQQVVTVIGTGSLFNSPCLSQLVNGSLDAQIDELQRTIAGSITFPGGGVVNFTANVAANSAQATGVYGVASGACSGDHGTVTVTKTVPLEPIATRRVQVYLGNELVEEIIVLGRASVAEGRGAN